MTLTNISLTNHRPVCFDPGTLLSLEEGEIEQIRECVMTARHKQASARGDGRSTSRHRASASSSARSDQPRWDGPDAGAEFGVGDEYEGHSGTLHRARKLTETLKRARRSRPRRAKQV